MVTQHACEPKVCDTCKEIAVDQNVALRAISRDRTPEELDLRFSNLREQTASHEDTLVHERRLPAAGGWVGNYSGSERAPTNFDRLAPGDAVTNSMIVPCSIETIIRVYEDSVAPSSGNRFGCLNCFHSTTSWQSSVSLSSAHPHFQTEVHRKTYHFRAGAIRTVTDLLDCDLGTSVPSTKHVRAATTPAWEFFDMLQLNGYDV